MIRCPVSVIIPTFNRAKLLGRAIGSVLDQTLLCSELIIVDDGSTDCTPALLGNILSSTQQSIRIYRQANRGPAAARNVGVRAARFPFVAFLDSDDHWHKRKLEKQYQSLVDHPQYWISNTREKWFRKGHHLNQKKKHIPRHGDIFEHCLQLCVVGMSTVMMKKELFDHVGLFDESLPCCEDYDLWLRVSCRYPFLLIDEPLTSKEGGREDQVSFQYFQGMDRLRIDSLRKLLDADGLDLGRYRMALDAFKTKVTIFGNGCLKHGNTELGRSYLELTAVYEKIAVKKYPILQECIDA